MIISLGTCIFFTNYAKKSFKDFRFFRFDLKTERAEGRNTLKLALAPVFWNSFIENCGACYKLGGNHTDDEQLLPSKATGPVTQYISNKPDKSGIKF